MGHLAVDVVIVGGGPRGISVVERLVARSDPWLAPIEVAIVDAVEVGAGATWRTDQVPEFLNNTYAAQTTVIPDDATPIPPPLVEVQDLMAWAGQVRPGEGRPGWVHGEASRLTPSSYPTRRIQGAYFKEQLDRVEATGRVRLHRIADTATSIVTDTRADRRQAVRLASGGVIDAAVVVLAQGMIQARPAGDVVTFTEAARSHGLVYLEPGMPAERDWDAVPGGEPVLVRGLGANFFDVFPVLTSARGGRYRRVDGRLRYQPNGREPVLHAGSRRGLPYRSKAWYPGGFPPPYLPRFATADWFRTLPGNLDFVTDVWPQIVRELAWAHLTTLADHRPATLDLSPHEVEPELRHAEPVDVDALTAAAVADPRWSFVVAGLDRPLHAAAFDEAGWRAWVADYVETELAAIRHPLTHPRNTVNRAMNAVRRHVGLLGHQGRFTGRSTVRDVFGWFNSLGLFMASGPPPGRTEEALALIDAGVLHLIGPSTVYQVSGGRFAASSPAVRRPPIAAEALIETRMSKGKAKGTSDPLIADLLDSGRARLYGFPDPDGGRTLSTSLDVSRDGLRLRADDGTTSPRVFVLGIPAEAVQPNSTLGANPRVLSVFFLNTDTVAAEALTILDRSPAPQSAAPTARHPASSWTGDPETSMTARRETMTDETPAITHLVDADSGAARVADGAILLDVRSQERRAEVGGVPGAVAVSKAALDEAFALGAEGSVEGLTSRDQEIVVFCGSVNGSQKVVDYLVGHGFTNVVHIDGGFGSWKEAGHPVTAPAEPVATA